MEEYLILIILTVLGIVSYKRLPNKQATVYFVFLCLYMILLIGLRYRVGIDTINYMISYQNVPSWKNFGKIDFSQSRFEPGYMFICTLCKSITPDFWLLQMVMACITGLGVFTFIYRYCQNPFIGLFVYIILAWLYFSTEIMRESASISLFLLNFENLKKKRWVRFYLFSVFSIVFHYSAVIIWLFPLVERLKKVNVWYIVVLLGFLAITPLIESLNGLFVLATVNKRISQYVESAEILNMNWRIASFIKSGVVPIIILFLLSRSHLTDKFKPFLMLHLLFCAGAFSIPIIFSRFTNYTCLFVIVIVANILVSKKVGTFNRHILFCVLLLSQTWYYYKMYPGWIPYVSVFEPEKVKDRELMWYEYN
jgi:hypothetical protein